MTELLWAPKHDTGILRGESTPQVWGVLTSHLKTPPSVQDRPSRALGRSAPVPGVSRDVRYRVDGG